MTISLHLHSVRPRLHHLRLTLSIWQLVCLCRCRHASPCSPDLQEWLPNSSNLFSRSTDLCTNGVIAHILWALTSASAPSDAVQHAHPPVHTSPYDRIANQSHFFNGQCVEQNSAESPSFLIECLDVARSRSLSGTRTAALCFLSHHAEKEQKYFLKTRSCPGKKKLCAWKQWLSGMSSPNVSSHFSQPGS